MFPNLSSLPVSAPEERSIFGDGLKALQEKVDDQLAVLKEYRPMEDLTIEALKTHQDRMFGIISDCVDDLRYLKGFRPSLSDPFKEKGMKDAVSSAIQDIEIHIVQMPGGLSPEYAEYSRFKEHREQILATMRALEERLAAVLYFVNPNSKRPADSDAGEGASRKQRTDGGA